MPLLTPGLPGTSCVVRRRQSASGQTTVLAPQALEQVRSGTAAMTKRISTRVARGAARDAQLVELRLRTVSNVVRLSSVPASRINTHLI